MSSKRSIVMEKWRQGLGLHKGTQDIEVNVAVERLAELEASIEELKDYLEEFNRAQSDAAAKSKGMLRTINMLSQADNPSQEFYESITKVGERLDSEVSEKMSSLFDKIVLGKVSQWLGDLVNVRSLIADHAKHRLVYDHYKTKVEGLREERRKRTEKGKAEGAKNQAKLQRNEDKLGEAKRVFDNTRTDVLQTIRAAVARKHDNLDVILLRIVQYRVYAGKEAAWGVKELEPTMRAMSKDLKERCVRVLICVW